VFVTLFNLQGAHRSQRREFILPHHFRLVKNFFQVFQPFLSFQTSRRAAPYFARRLSRRLAYFSTSFSLCQELFFRNFSARFRSLIQNLYLEVPAPLSGDPSRKRLAIIANPASFVKHFFRLFSAFSFCLSLENILPQNSLLHNHLSYDTLILS